MMELKELRKTFSGRVYKCLDTGQTVTLPDDVRFGQCIQIGNGYIDVGDGYYFRVGGNIIEITVDNE